MARVLRRIPENFCGIVQVDAIGKRYIWDGVCGWPHLSIELTDYASLATWDAAAAYWLLDD